MSDFINSWHLKTPDLIDSSSETHHYICKCGNIKHISLPKNDFSFPYLICKKCSNSYYIDFEKFNKKKSSRYYWKTFKWSYRFTTDDNGWSMIFYYNTPTFLNSFHHIGSRENIIIELTMKKEIGLDFIIHDDGIMRYQTYDKLGQDIMSLIVDEYATPFFGYIKENRALHLKWLDFSKFDSFSTKKMVKIVDYFMSNTDFRDEKLYFWDFKSCDTLKQNITDENSALNAILQNNQKSSVKKALYRSYVKSLTSKYDPAFDYFVINVFKDENYVVRLLSFSQEEKTNFLNGYDVKEIINTFTFLSQRYSQKLLFKLINDFYKSANNRILLHDIFRMCADEEYIQIYLDHFIKPNANIRAIHDEIARVARLHIRVFARRSDIDANEPLKYDDIYKNSSINLEGLDFKLPININELSLWANELHNCMASYDIDVYKKRCVIYGVFHNNSLKYAVEIREKNIKQAKGKFNKDICHSDMQIIESWHNQYISRITINQDIHFKIAV